MSSMNPAPGQTVMPQQDPGRTLGIVGLILAFVAPLIGLILSAVAMNQSKKVGINNKIAKAGVIVGIITTIGVILISVLANMAAMKIRNGG